jgi:hypothetical protein
MTILTDRELILIREEEARNREDRYGGVWDYIPLSKIVSLSLNARDSNLLGLSIQLQEDTGFELLFQTSAREELNRLLDCFKALTGE